MQFIRISFLIGISLCSYSFAQYNIHIKIKALPAGHTWDQVFIAGSFNAWDPADQKYRFTRSGDSAILEMTGIKEKEIEFKFTRGGWEYTEVNDKGEDIPNRKLKLVSDTSIEVRIHAWRDDFTREEKHHTLSPNVSVMDTAFLMPRLSKERRIWIYLPPGYSSGKKKYPVLYMHDGQNIFDAYTAMNGEWEVDEWLDSVIQIGKQPCIVVAIDHSDHRLNEYNPFDHEAFGKEEGREYVRFLVESLKPFIDQHYRTLPDRNNTFMAGSSMGGLITYYALLRYPDVFGKGGIFSPSFGIAPGIKELTDSLASKVNGQLFFYSGALESEKMKPDVELITDQLGERSTALIYSVTDPEGKHNEKYWQKWFGEFYYWITGNGLNYQVRTGP